MSVKVTANSFSGKYGSDKDIGDIIHIHIEVGKSEPLSTNKEILFLVDTSASMEESLKEVKSSVLAFRDSLVCKTPVEMEALTKSERDHLFRNTISTHFITFSNEAKEEWNNDSEKFFEDVVINLRSEALTNMGDALKMAFENADRNSFSWIIAMTDGESNRGPCRTQDSFQRLVTSGKPLNSKIISLGYGSKFDPEVLNVLGTFAYVENSEVIPIVLGNLAEEIMMSVGFNCVVDIPNAQLVSEITEDTIIVPEGQNNIIPGKIISGDRMIGSLCAGKSYDIIYLPHGNHQSTSQLERLNNVLVRYTDIQSREEIIAEVPVTHTYSEPTAKHRELYFESEKKRLVYSLYKGMQANSKELDKVLKRVEQKIATWTDPLANIHKEELRKMVNDTRRRDHRTMNHQASAFLNRAVGSGYAVVNDSDEGHGYATVTISSSRYYLDSPLVNNDN